MTSAGPSEGKTTTVANLAAMFAEADNSVLVINCDFRRPRLHRFLGGSDEPRKVVQSEIDGVRMVNNVLSNPNPNPAEVAAAQRQVVEAARGMFDVVILDTAPLLSTNDASEIMSSADVVVLVSQAGKTSKSSAARATEVLQRMEATVAGVALLGARYVPTRAVLLLRQRQRSEPQPGRGRVPPPRPADPHRHRRQRQGGRLPDRHEGPERHGRLPDRRLGVQLRRRR